MNAIVAADEKWGIGKNGGLLIHLPGDMKYFRETTKGKVVVMGRKTLESLPGGQPLKNRTNLVLTRNRDLLPGGVTACSGIEEALKELEKCQEEDIFIIGGGMIYREFLPYCKRIYVTHIDSSFQADTYFVNLDQLEEWELECVSPKKEDQGISYEFRIYKRKDGQFEKPVVTWDRK